MEVPCIWNWVPPVDNFTSTVKQCRANKNLADAKFVHFSCHNDIECIGNYIVPMLVDCGGMSDAQQVFTTLVDGNVHSWNSLILGSLQYGQPHHAFIMYEKMQKDAICPSSYTFVALIRASIKLRDLENGRRIHLKVIEKGLDKNTYVGTTLIVMYAQFGYLREAREVFDKLPVRNVVSWTALIHAYAEHGHSWEAFKCFEQMEQDGQIANVATFLCVVKACGAIGAIDKGREIHTKMAEKGFQKNQFVGNALINMYAKCHALADAEKVLFSLNFRDTVSWNSMITGYTENNHPEDALECFNQLQLEGVAPDAVTFISILKSCSNMGIITKGREIHSMILKKGFNIDPFMGNALFDMYIKCGSLSEAHKVFDMLLVQDVVSWNTLIAGYADKDGRKALKCFEQMHIEGIFPNAVTFACILRACTSIRWIEKGKEIHRMVVEKKFDKDIVVCNTLIDMYTKCGSLVEAQKVFDKLPLLDPVTWNSLIAGYNEHGLGLQAVTHFEQMRLWGISQNTVTYTCGLNGCASIGAIEKGRQIHRDATEKSAELDVFVGSALVDMYAKCGSVADAQRVFERLSIQNTAAWNAMIRGYSTNHKCSMAIQCFDAMMQQNIQPDSITFICVLTACSRASLVTTGQVYFKNMQEKYGIIPTADHYSCMVDLFARSGHLFEAVHLLETLPSYTCIESWMALLSSCKVYGEAELGLRCFQQLVQIDKESASPYVLLESIYAGAGMYIDAVRIGELRKNTGVKKKPARAFIEINEKVHEFVVGSNKSNEVLAMLENLNSRIKQDGHVPNVDLFIWPTSDIEREASLCGHAEKLAVAFGLLHLPQGQTLRVTKNLRMCTDCHDVMKVISRIERRKIILQESNWVHHFKEGLCSCGDMW